MISFDTAAAAILAELAKKPEGLNANQLWSAIEGNPHKLDLPIGGLYTYLQMLEANGSISKDERPNHNPGSDSPTRSYFQITELGKTKRQALVADIAAEQTSGVGAGKPSTAR